MKILIADDDLSIRVLLEEWTRQWGYDPVCVPDGESAWQILTANNPPTLAILDWRMPKMDGIRICQKIKQMKDFPFVYKLLLTQKNLKSDLVTGLEAGADDFLSKPVYPPELRSRLMVGKRIIDYQAEHSHHYEQLQTLLSAVPGVVLFKDEQNRWIQANEAGLQFFKLTQVDYVGKTDEQLAQHPHARATILKALQAKDEQVWQAAEILREELQCLNEYGQTICFEVTWVPLFYRDGRRKSLVVLGNDITAHKNLQQRLIQEARYDVLTNLLNRRYFEERLETAIHYAQRFQHPVSLCLCDIDKFKMVNDSYGHDVGDKVIKYFSQILRSELRRVDAAGRLGGDEFGILFSGSTPQQSLNCLNRIRERLERMVFQDEEGHSFSVSASFGIAEWKIPPMKNKEALFKSADKALYQAKGAGRNQVIIYNPSHES